MASCHILAAMLPSLHLKLAAICRSHCGGRSEQKRASSCAAFIIWSWIGVPWSRDTVPSIAPITALLIDCLNYTIVNQEAQRLRGLKDEGTCLLSRGNRRPSPQVLHPLAAPWVCTWRSSPAHPVGSFMGVLVHLPHSTFGSGSSSVRSQVRRQKGPVPSA